MGGHFFSEGAFFSRNYFESGLTLLNKTHFLTPSRYGVNRKSIQQWRKYGTGLRELTLKTGDWVYIAANQKMNGKYDFLGCVHIDRAFIGISHFATIFGN